MEEYRVAIICNTYNQENYIEQALKSFLMQKTNFKFKIFVHDDASKDKTSQIVRMYAEKYPDLIIPILEQENQFSKNISITYSIIRPLLKCKYFAFCEGDDFWIDENKLQKQYDYMEKNPSCTLCMHNAIYVKKNGKYLRDLINVEENRIFTINEMINIGFAATASMFARVEDMKKTPDFFKEFSLDYLQQIFYTSIGYTYFMNDKMSAYRDAAKNSWTVRMKLDTKYAIDFTTKRIIALEKIKDYLNNAYIKEIDNVILKNKFKIHLWQQDKKILFKDPYLKIYKELSFFGKIRFNVELFFPKLYKILQKIRNI